ncbi:MAG TPA: hypothetical protein VG244_12900 [Acidimicrobiales bacterium]|nr:hypothetical protein [Acidimicrobiales bacterium]
MGLVVMTVLTALTSTAGAATTVTQWNVTGNGGFVSLDVLNALQLAGGGSEADATSAALAEASGTGLCADTAVTTNPCPTNATSPVSGNLLGSTQDAIAKGNGVTATPTGGGCTLPLDTGLINIDVSCGKASASEDSTGNPTATGTGSLASVSVSLSLTSLLGLGSSAGSLCSGTTAATTAGGAGAGGLTGTLGTLLSTVNTVLGGLSLPGLNGSTVDSASTSTGTCSLLGGLLNSLNGTSGAGAGLGILTGVLNQVLGLVTAGNGVAIAPLSVNIGGSSSSVTTNGNVVTDAVEQSPVDINVFGLADLKVTPTTASVALDRSTGIVTPACQAGVLSLSTNGGLQNFLSLGSLTSAVNQLLAQLSTTLDGLTSFLTSLIGDLIDYNPTGNLLTCDVSAPGPTAHADVAIANTSLLTGLMGGLGIAVGDVSASGSATTATPAAVTTSAAKPAAPAAAPLAPTAVPNVTTVHTGEFWSGSLPIILLTGMGLAGVMLIGRRRIFSAARSMNLIARRRGGQ